MTAPRLAPDLGVAVGARGANAGANMLPLLDHLQAAGAHHVRCGSRPAPGGVQNWSAIEEYVDAVLARGMKVIFQIAGWDNDMDDHPEEYGTYAGACAQHLGEKVWLWEPGNEPMHVIFSKNPTPARYTELLKRAYTAVKHYVPDAIVMTGGLGGTNADDVPGVNNPTIVDFLAGMYDAGAKDFFDVLAAHPYGYPNSAEQQIAAGRGGIWLMREMHRLMVERGDSAKQIAVTEFSYPTGPHAPFVSEQTQAAMLVDNVTWMRKHPWMGPITWFDHQDAAQPTGAGNGDHMGLYRADWSPKPIVAEFKRLAKAA